MNLKIRLLVALLLSLTLAGCSATESESAPRASLVSVDSNPALDTQAWEPFPTTVSGYRSLFRSVSPHYWGAADVSISVKVFGGYRVWLYGDTISGRNGFVHSTAIVQRGGLVRVSSDGEQVIPDDERVCADGECRDQIYWIEQARWRSSDQSLLITAAPMSIGKASVWDFRRADGHENESRLGLAKVTRAGDVVFKEWLRYVERPLLTGDGEDFKVIEPNHFTYQEVVHDIELEDGTWLKTVCQNWDDGEFHTDGAGQIIWADYRPLWRASLSSKLMIEPWPDHLPPS